MVFHLEYYVNYLMLFLSSILNYGCEVWEFSKSKDIEKIHLKFLKLILGVTKSTSSMAVYGETGRYP